ncbi:unnamed protein product [Echinostoma caproni]|uniref:Protein kinase domain-containing protein n=1 Tax=Echinostoma caproni TaxID=27848 RepID=A0A183AH29_9TREM|nr:unnamed protein product [Echinostoma caproni]
MPAQRVHLFAQNGHVTYEHMHLPITRKISARCAAELPPNMDESQLEVLGSIGTGAFGRALKVRHREHGHLLVLKEVLTECKEDEAALVREISLLCSLKHPNILSCIGVVTRNRKICLLTEYISRGCLHNLVIDPHRYPLSWSIRVSFAKDIATGMVGSPFWMAPEMLAGKPYDDAVDVYSFGIILCQLLARCEADPDHIPRDPNSMSVDMNQFLTSGLIPDDRPDMLIALATRCVAFDPEERCAFPYTFDQ